MNERDTLAVLAEEIATALSPLKRAVSNYDQFANFMLDLGWEVDEIPKPIADLGNKLNNLVVILQKIKKGTATQKDYIDLFTAIVNLFSAIKDITNAPPGSFSSSLIKDNFLSEFPNQLIQYLLIEYLRCPVIKGILQALGLIKIEILSPAGDRPDYVKRQVMWSDFTTPLTNPVLMLEKVYSWGKSDFNYLQFFEYILYLTDALNAKAHFVELDPNLVQGVEGKTKLPADPNRWCVRIIFLAKDSGSSTEAGLSIFPLPEDGMLKPGLALLPYATGKLEKKVKVSKHLFLTFESALDLTGGVGIIIRPGKPIQILNDIISSVTSGKTPPSGGQLKICLEYSNSNAKPKTLISLTDASRFEVKGLSACGGVTLLSSGKQELLFELKIIGGKIVIKATKGDSFLSKILPKNGITANFDFIIGFSSLQGVYFQGSSSLEVKLPVHFNLGPIEVNGIYVAIAIGKNNGIPIELSSSVSTKLGPLAVTIDRMGLSAIFSFPKDYDGNLGPIDLDLDFKPPDGIRLSIDGQGFKGGGFLLFDHYNKRYSGAIELEFKNTIELKAIGLITTKLPGGEKGFSLLIIISAEFTPIQLGYGFTLNGVGGLLGLNRTMKIERLRTGIKENTLKSILFPTNIIANADRIISDLRQVFPPEQDRFVFGPMAKIGWGTPTLITIELGLIIEVPNPVRIVILGVVKTLLPDEKLRLLKIQVNFLGVLDFQKQRLAFDASLYDSRLLGYTLSGSMALRLSWGDNPNFILTVGGFHPAYNPPSMALGKLVRITVNLLGGKNPRLTLESYFAVTSNTVQFGAKIELYAAAWKFNVYGFLAFDVLFQFSPFYFIASIGAMLAVRIGSASLFSVSLSLTLAGPTPWNAKGYAKFKIFWFITIKIKFNKTWGEKRNTTLPDVDVFPLLKAAIKNKGNWQAQIPPRSNLLVTIKEIKDVGSTTIAHPFGILAVSQKVVPLNLRIDKFGHQKPKSINLFKIKEVKSGTQGLATTSVKEFFAPALFFDMKDSDRLSRKSFEKYDSGVKIKASEEIHSSHYVKLDVKYELKYFDTRKLLMIFGGLFKMSAIVFSSLLKGNATAKSELSFAKKAKSPLAPKAVSVNQEKFAVVNNSDLRLFSKGAVADSEAEAYSKMEGLITKDPDLANQIQVVPAYEVSSS